MTWCNRRLHGVPHRLFLVMMQDVAAQKERRNRGQATEEEKKKSRLSCADALHSACAPDAGTVIRAGRMPSCSFLPAYHACRHAHAGSCSRGPFALIPARAGTCPPFLLPAACSVLLDICFTLSFLHRFLCAFAALPAFTRRILLNVQTLPVVGLLPFISAAAYLTLYIYLSRAYARRVPRNNATLLEHQDIYYRTRLLFLTEHLYRLDLRDFRSIADHYPPALDIRSPDCSSMPARHPTCPHTTGALLAMTTWCRALPTPVTTMPVPLRLHTGRLFAGWRHRRRGGRGCRPRGRALRRLAD